MQWDFIQYPTQIKVLLYPTFLFSILKCLQQDPDVETDVDWLLHTALSFIVKLCTTQGERDLLGNGKSAGLTL